VSLEDSLKQMLAEDDGVEATSVEVGGVKVTTNTVTDVMGKVWAVPADDENIDLREFRNLLEHYGKDPNFHYQYVHKERLKEFLSTGFGMVDRREAGIPNPIDDGHDPLNTSTDTSYQVGDLVLCKIPKVIADRRMKIKDMRADEAKAGILIPRHLGKVFGESGVQIKSRETQTVKGPLVVTPAKEFKTFEDEA